MKTTVEKLERCQVKVAVELGADEVRAVVRDVEKQFMRQAQIPGFRKGKVPLQIIRKEFKDSLAGEIATQVVRRYHGEAVKAEKIDEVAVTAVDEVNVGDDSAAFKMTIEVKPVFNLPTYKGLEVAEGDTRVDDLAVAEQIEQMRTRFAKFEDAAEGEQVAKGDYVQIDYSGTVDGKPILEINPEAKIVASGTGFWVQVEEGRFLPEILDALPGMRTGETKGEIRAKFDSESAPEGLKGAEAVYGVTLKAFRRRILPTDEAFVEQLKVESIDKLTAQVREGMEKQAVQREKVRRENEVIDLLLRKVDFDVPASQVERMKDRYLEEMAQRAQYAGLGADYIEQNRENIQAEAEANAVKQVRLWYLIDAIAAAENLACPENERGAKVVELLLANAKK